MYIGRNQLYFKIYQAISIRNESSLSHQCAYGIMKLAYRNYANKKVKKELGIMRYIISGKNIDVTEGLKTAVYEKIGKLERYFTPDTEIHVTLSVEKERQKIEVTIPVKGNIIRAEQVSNDMYVSIDLVEEIIERQLRKYKNKLIDHKQASSNFNQAFMEDDYYEDDSIRIVKTKRFAIKPMDAEEACVQMELLGHNFYVFRNAQTNEVNVVYKRKGNTYGLIEPEF
jgi:putative sigma-54 modulation protein